MKEKRSLNTRVTQEEDGKYRWVYEMSLFKNPTVFLLVWSIFFFIFIAIFAVMTIVDLIEWGPNKVVENLPFLLYFLLGMTVVVALGYLLYAAIMGGKYIVEFEMDEKGILHRQIASQAKKSKKIGEVAATGGILTGRYSAAGAGIGAQRTEMYSDFSKTKKVTARRMRNLIKVNGLLSHNQVYVQKEDFDFVKDYIISHCPNLKTKKK